MSCVVLFLVLAVLFGIGDSVSIIKENFSYRVSTTIWHLVLGMYLVFGIGAHIIVARLTHKKQQTMHDVTYTQQVHTQKEQAAFHHVKQEFGRLFSEDDVSKR